MHHIGGVRPSSISLGVGTKNDFQGKRVLLVSSFSDCGATIVAKNT